VVVPEGTGVGAPVELVDPEGFPDEDDADPVDPELEA